MFQGHFWCFERRLQCITVVYMVLVVEIGEDWQLGQSWGVVWGSVGFWNFSDKIEKMWKSPNRFCFGEVGFDLDIGGLDMI
jgi:hypothetical protein